MSSAEQSPIGQDGGGDRQRKARRAEHARNRTLRSALVAVPAASVNGAAAVSQRPAANGSLALVPPATRRPMRQVTDAARSPMMEPQYVRLLVTAAEAVRVSPFAGLSTADVNGGPGVSHRAFEEHLAGREAALLQAFEQALALAAARASAAFEAQEAWLDRVRAGLRSLLEFFDEEPELARFLVVHSAQAGPVVLARRGEVLDRLALVLDDERAPARGYPPPLTAQAVVSGVLGVLHGRLSKPNPGPLVKLTGSLMSFVVLPFLGVRAARMELSRPLDATSAVGRSVAVDLLEDPGGRRNHQRTMLVLRAVAEEPGLSNRELALRAGVKAEAHVSRVLARFARLGLIENTRDARGPGAAKAWQLTAGAQELERALAHEAPAPSVTFDLPQEFVGRLDDRTASVLRVIGEQPWLSSREVARRVGVEDRKISYLLRRLVGLGLLASTRDAQLRGAPNVWQLTVSGVQLDGAIGRETPARKRSVALDLMQDSGGRLSDHAVSALRAIGAEPGLSNRVLARRVGITEMHTYKLLARVAERGLIENTRSSGRENVWQLTASGQELERAIWQETPAAVQRSVALDLLRDSGGRLSDRAVSVLRLIGSEPGLSNNEIALRVAVKDPEEISHLLRRLARFALIENTRRSGRENVWQLTVSGKEFDGVIGRETPARKRSVALDLMQHSGGRLSDPAISVLRLIGGEPGLSNGELALRVGVTDQKRISLLLARLAERGLIENTRREGRENVWQLTASGEELERAIWQETSAAVQRSVALDLLRDPDGRLSDGAVSVLRLIGAEPGHSNGELALCVGVRDPSPMSHLLARLARFSLIENTRRSGRENVWQLTTSGIELERAIWLQTPAAVQRSVALDLLRDRRGRLSDRAVSVLMLIGSEPGHSNREIARRVGIEQESRISALLSRLARLGLIQNTKTGGRHNVWQLTASGRELDAVIERETAALGRSAALDLPGGFGRGLSDDAVSALRVIAAQPGHSNSEIARRVGIERTGKASKLLARLAGLGLIENTKPAGHKNAWQLTASGTELARAIRQEPEAPVARSTALDLGKDRGGRLNHRAVSVLTAIAAEPGLSNSDLAGRAGIRAKSQMSRVLARLVRLGLIENAVDDPGLFEANAWQLTAGGRNLDSAIRRESPDAGLKGPRGESPSRAAMVKAKPERSLLR